MIRSVFGIAERCHWLQPIAMTKTQMIARLARIHGINQGRMRLILNDFLNGSADSLAQGRVVDWRDFGQFKVVIRKEKWGRNPRRPALTFFIPERSQVRFYPGKELKRKVLKVHDGIRTEAS